jgi:hypothetical protein
MNPFSINNGFNILACLFFDRLDYNLLRLEDLYFFKGRPLPVFLSFEKFLSNPSQKSPSANDALSDDFIIYLQAIGQIGIERPNLTTTKNPEAGFEVCLAGVYSDSGTVCASFASSSIIICPHSCIFRSE